MNEELKRLLEKSEWENTRVREIMFSYAIQKDLDEFHKEWRNKSYSDSDHSTPNMLLDFIDAIDRSKRDLMD